MRQAFKRKAVEMLEEADLPLADTEQINLIRKLQAVRILIAEAEFIGAQNRTYALNVQFQQLKEQVLGQFASIQEDRKCQRSTLLTTANNSIRSVNQWREVEINLNRQLDLAKSALDDSRKKLTASEREFEVCRNKKMQVDRRLMKLDELVKLLEIE